MIRVVRVHVELHLFARAEPNPGVLQHVGEWAGADAGVSFNVLLRRARHCIPVARTDAPPSLAPQGFVGLDLVEGEGVHVGAGLPGAVPLDEPLEGGFEVEAGGPVEVGVGAAGVELEVAGFVGAGVRVEDPGGSVAPEGGHLFDDPADGLGVVFGGAEVVGGGVAGGSWVEEVFGEARCSRGGARGRAARGGWREGGG